VPGALERAVSSPGLRRRSSPRVGVASAGPSVARALTLFIAGFGVSLGVVLAADGLAPLIAVVAVMALLFAGLMLSVAGMTWLQAAQRLYSRLRHRRDPPPQA
jgi:uncharacterized membrane protein YphA (DoxX/SURF4 family)